MKTITVNQFDGGMTDDLFNGAAGEFSVAKQFDVLTYANRLAPLRGMAADTAGTGIGNIIIESSTGLPYGVGTQTLFPLLGEIWRRVGYGASDTWQVLPSEQTVGAAPQYSFLVDWRNAGTVRTLYWAGANTLVASDPAGGGIDAQHSLTFTRIGQGFVHPADQILYFPYNTSSDCLIGALVTNATEFAGINATALTLPKQYQVYNLCSYGNYLAIPATTSNSSSVSASRVFFWSRDTTQSWDYDISWGGGELKVLNNLNGTLIGISANSGNGSSGAIQDRASISIKGYEGGEPFLIKEISAQHLVASSFPTVSINPNVNFVKDNRLYFSVNIVPNDGVSNTYYGLWSIGKNRFGRYTLNMERIATNGNTETGVLAAGIAGDFVSMVHTANGTITSTINGQTASTTYAATSVYESLVNPNMPPIDKVKPKKLIGVACHFLPLPASSQVVLKVRVDSNNTADWKTVFTKTPSSPDANLTAYETQITPSMNIPDGRNIEIRLESTGGAAITGFSYVYDEATSIL